MAPNTKDKTIKVLRAPGKKDKTNVLRVQDQRDSTIKVRMAPD